MGNTFYNEYMHYFLWNSALVSHFFDENRSKEQILLYVDEVILERIGKKKGIKAENYKNDFMNAVRCFCDNYNKYVCPKLEPNRELACSQNDCKYYTRTYCLKKEDRHNVLSVANHIYSKGIKYWDKTIDSEGKIRITIDGGKAIECKLPFLGIIIYLLILFDKGEIQQWSNTGSETTASTRPYIKELWDLLGQYDSRFDSESSVFEKTDRGDYAGRIKYHLPLSASISQKIHDAIYKSSSWKLIGLVPFVELISRIQRSIKDNNTNEIINSIITLKFSNRDDEHNNVSLRKLQSVIEDFNIDKYMTELKDREYKPEYKKTDITGEFALGLYYPEDNSGEENSVVLLTTVQQQIEQNEYFIAEGDSGTFAGYNTNFVKVNGSEAVSIKEYSITKKGYSIKPILVEDVVFFYKHDDGLYIQTRRIIPSGAYVIAVKEGVEERFEEWCQHNNNNPIKLSDTEELYGKGWTIYYNDRSLNGQYYVDKVVNEQLSSANLISVGGGIKNYNGHYFVNALPYFEIPALYDSRSLEILISINGKLFENYELITSSGTTIIDIKSTPVLTGATSYCDISIYEKNTLLFHTDIEITGQSISYDPLSLYRYDKFGNLCDKNDACFYGNTVINKSRVIVGASRPEVSILTEITEDFYFTNLLAACCYNAENAEIGHDKFRKCVNYASTRLGIDTQQAGFIRNVKRICARAGIISIDYARTKYQAIPPSFSKCPYSMGRASNHQMYLLSGCYTKVFLADLLYFCAETKTNVYVLNQVRNRNEVEKFLPPVVLLDSTFVSQTFKEKYNHQFDVIENYDMAYALLDLAPDVNYISKQFKYISEDESVLCLEPSKTTQLPRVRKDKGVHHQHWYLESAEGKFALIDKAMLPWASIYAMRCNNKPIVIVRNNNILITRDVLLPIYVQRALYMMNLGLPTIEKVFICNNRGNDGYYSLMDNYNMGSGNEDRSKLLSEKLTGGPINSTPLSRTYIRTKYRMSFWKSRNIGKKNTERYLVLYSEINQPMAIAYEDSVYLKCNEKFKKLSCRSINEGLSYLITERNWRFGNAYSSIGCYSQGGLAYVPKYNFLAVNIEEPQEENFIIEEITIV